MALACAALGAASASAAFDAPPLRVSADGFVNGAGAQLSSVAVNGRGDAVVFWQHAQRKPRRRTTMLARRFDAPTGTWSDIEPLSAPSRAKIKQDPAVALDDAANAFAVWPNTLDSTDEALTMAQLKARRFDAASGAWEPAVRLSVRHGVAVYPTVAVDGRGNALVVWYQYLPDGPEDVRHHDNAFVAMYARRFDAGTGRWDGEPIQLSERRVNRTGPFAGSPRVRFDARGDATVLWAEAVEERRHVIHSRRYDAQSRTWTPAITLSDGGNSAFSADLATAASGDTTAVWVESLAGRGDVVRSKRYDAQTGQWDAVASDLTGAVPTARFARVAVDGTGNATAVWSQFGSERRSKVGIARYDAAAGRWTPAPVSLSAESIRTIRPQVAADDEGNVVATWSGFAADGTERVQATRFDAATEHWLAAPAVMSPERSTSSQVALGAGGDGYITWFEYNARKGRVLVAGALP